jgi:hypothetical protein
MSWSSCRDQIPKCRYPRRVRRASVYVDDDEAEGLRRVAASEGSHRRGSSGDSLTVSRADAVLRPSFEEGVDARSR